jgi:hypothetical protein
VALVAVAARFTLRPEHTGLLPVKADTTGVGLTVTVTVAVFVQLVAELVAVTV